MAIGEEGRFSSLPDCPIERQDGQSKEEHQALLSAPQFDASVNFRPKGIWANCQDSGPLSISKDGCNCVLPLKELGVEPIWNICFREKALFLEGCRPWLASTICPWSRAICGSCWWMWAVSTPAYPVVRELFSYSGFYFNCGSVIYGPGGLLTTMGKGQGASSQKEILLWRSGKIFPTRIQWESGLEDIYVQLFQMIWFSRQGYIFLTQWVPTQWICH